MIVNILLFVCIIVFMIISSFCRALNYSLLNTAVTCVNMLLCGFFEYRILRNRIKNHKLLILLLIIQFVVFFAVFILGENL